jgi:acetyl-CoA acyltransferase 1
MAQLHVSIPQECTLATVNRQCSSGIQAISIVANAISSGNIGIGIRAGAESISNDYIASTLPPGQKVNWF